jgi:DNA-directed RNA polymerase subunit K/omega
MINRSPLANAFEFVVIAALRTQQLQRGCLQRVVGTHKFTTLAQMEIVAGKVARMPPVVEAHGQVEPRASALDPGADQAPAS